MGANTDKNLEKIVHELIQETKDINDLNMGKLSQRQALLTALEQRPALVKRVTPERSSAILKYALDHNPMLFVHLKRTQYTDELAQIFLYNRLTENERLSKKAAHVASYEGDITTQKSLDDKIVLAYSYVTPEGSELYYFDKELQVPVGIRANIMITLKLTNAVKLIEKLDTHITQLGEMKIKTALSDAITNKFKAYLNDYIEKNDAGFYSLSAKSSELENGFKSIADDFLARYGFIVTDFIIKKLAIPKDIQNKIEDLSFDLRQRKEEVKADTEFAKLSLENYETKLSIQSKYPESEPTLTEYEKDLALKRYLKKQGLDNSGAIDRSIAIQQSRVVKDNVIEKGEDNVPEVKEKNGFKTWFIILAAASTIASFSLFGTALGWGLITLGLTAGVFGTIAAFNKDKFFKKKETATEEGSTDILIGGDSNE